MTVNIAIGQVAVPSQNNTGSTLCSSDATDQVTLTAANGTNPRIDVVTCHPRGNDLDGGGNNDFIFDFVTGTPAASPTVPATPAGQVALAQILVPAQSASISAGNITDVRPGGLSVPATGPGSAPRGYVGDTTGPASQTDVTTNVVVVSLSAPVIAGRRYRFSGFAQGTQLASGTSVQAYAVDDQSGPSFYCFYNTSVTVANSVMIGSCVGWFVATSTRTATISLRAVSSSALRFPAGFSRLLLEDIGSS
jgi:hypothetical protein